MTHPTDDDLIRERFRQLRADSERPGGVPDFAAMMDRARAEAAGPPPLRVLEPEVGAAPGERASRVLGGPRRRHALVVGGWASVAAAATVAALLLTDGRDAGDQEFDMLVSAFATDASTGAWRSPTSGLLDVPGVELLRSVPSVGASLRGMDPADVPGAPGPEGGEGRP